MNIMESEKWTDEQWAEWDRRSKGTDLFKKAVERAISKTICDFYSDYIRNHPNIILRELPMNLEDDYRRWDANRKGVYKYALATINFDQNKCTIEEMLNRMDKICRKIWIEKYIYCFECRDKEYNGIHVHMKIWIKDGKKPYECGREIYNTVKHVVGNRQHVNMRYSNIEGCFEPYIKGVKGDAMKKNHKYDLEFRQANGLKDLYMNF